MTADDRELRMRIVVDSPPAGVALALQRGRNGRLQPVRVTPRETVFEFAMRIVWRSNGGAPNFLGEFAQGTPAARFVYVNSGQSAGQMDSCWTRRAKVMLHAIDGELVRRVLDASHARLQARFHGTARDGGPACATVALVDGGWHPADA